MNKKLKVLVYFLLIIGNNLSFHPQNVPARYDLLTLKPSQIHFPEINNYSFQGGIYYYPSQKEFRYIASIYDPKGKRIIEKIHNEAGKIVQIIKYSYNEQGLLIQEELYNQYQELIKKVYYKNINKTNNDSSPENDLQEVHLLNEDNQKFHIEYHYSYNTNHQLINQLEYIYEISKSVIADNNYLQINSIIYTYLDNKKIAEHYSKSSKEGEFTFKHAEIYEYIYPEKIHRVIYLNKQKNIKKVIEYNYDDQFRIKKVNIFKPIRSMRWQGTLTHRFYQDFKISYYILYEYDEKKFSIITEKGVNLENKIHAKEVKYRSISNLEGSQKNYEIFKNQKKEVSEIKASSNKENPSTEKENNEADKKESPPEANQEIPSDTPEFKK